MKFDVEVPSINGIARLEIKTVLEENLWSAYLTFATDRSLNETCLVLGKGAPYRFAGASEKEAEAAARSFLEQNYHIVRIIW
jgi:hypothetical protein